MPVFLEPSQLILLILVPVMGLLLLLIERRFGNLRQSLADAEFLASLTNRRIRRKSRLLIWLCVITLLILALARPIIALPLLGNAAPISIMFVVDVSRSMAVRDMPPDRLQAALGVVRSCLEQLRPSDEVGLVVFSGMGFLQVPLTTDLITFQLHLDRLHVDMLPNASTDIEAGLQTALNALSDGFIILLSDGENQVGSSFELLQIAASQGVSIYTLGVGTEEGAPVPNARNSNEFLVGNDGNSVVSRLNSTLLQAIATQGGGAYYAANSARPADFMAQLHEHPVSQMETGLELSPFLVALALALLLIYHLYPEAQG